MKNIFLYHSGKISKIRLKSDFQDLFSAILNKFPKSQQNYNVGIPENMQKIVFPVSFKSWKIFNAGTGAAPLPVANSTYRSWLQILRRANYGHKIFEIASLKYEKVI